MKQNNENYLPATEPFESCLFLNFPPGTAIGLDFESGCRGLLLRLGLVDKREDSGAVGCCITADAHMLSLMQLPLLQLNPILATTHMVVAPVAVAAPVFRGAC